MNKKEIELVQSCHENGDAEGIFNLIKKYLDQDEPNALYYYSTISLPEWNESEVEMDERRVSLLKRAASGGVPVAMYQLACVYLYGEGVQRDREKGVHFARLSAESGYKYGQELLDQLI